MYMMTASSCAGPLRSGRWEGAMRWLARSMNGTILWSDRLCVCVYIAWLTECDCYVSLSIGLFAKWAVTVSMHMETCIIHASLDCYYRILDLDLVEV